MAACRSASVSTSCRSPSSPGRSISTAPAARCSSRDPGPNLGPNGSPGRAVYRVVPDPAASATNAWATCQAAARARPSSPGVSAGRSAVSAASPLPGQRAVQPRSAGIRDHARAEGGHLAADRRIVTHHQHRADALARHGRRDRVSRHRQRQRAPAVTGQARQPGLGHGQYLDGNDDRPRRRGGVRHVTRSCLDTEPAQRGDWDHEGLERVTMSGRADGSYSNFWRGVSKVLLRPAIRALMRHDWQGQEHFPAEGGVIIAANHLSYADVLALALFCDQAGRYPVFLAKSGLFDVKVLGWILARLGQLPVHRGQADAALVLRDAEQGLRNGACVIFYPEGTVTRDPALWPMRARTGVARLALTTGAPVIPVGHWGAQDILPYGTFRPRLLPRRTVRIIAGPPVDLSEFAGRPPDSAALRAATDKIMAEVAALVGKLRGEVPPAEPFHPAVARRKQRAELRALAGQASQSRPGPQGGQARE